MGGGGIDFHSFDSLCPVYGPLSMRGTVHTADTWQLQYSILSLEPKVAEIQFVLI